MIRRAATEAPAGISILISDLENDCPPYTLAMTSTPKNRVLIVPLESIYAAVYDASGIVFAFDREDRKNHENSYTFYLKYEGPLPTGNNVKVDVTVRESLAFPLLVRPVLRGYEEFTDLPVDRHIRVYALEEIATEKTLGSK